MRELIKQLKRHEGYSAKPYKCTANKITIGYGRNLEDVGITKSMAEDMLEEDVRTAEAFLFREYPTYMLFNAPRRDALVNMTFNLGITRLRHFRKMHAALTDGDFVEAANEMLDSKYAQQVGARAIELAEQLVRGEYR